MADRFFPNAMPYFLDESVDKAEAVPDTRENSLLYLLQIPYECATERFFNEGLKLREKVELETWNPEEMAAVQDYTLYTGSLGTAYLLLKCYQITGNRSDLEQCADIVSLCDDASQRANSEQTSSTNVSFLCGRAGVCAIGALAAKYLENDEQMADYVRSFREILFPFGVSNDLFSGRAGYLWGCLFLFKHLGHDNFPFYGLMVNLAKDIIFEGRRHPNRGQSPLMYEHNAWGASHGLAGIMYVLMEMEWALDPQEQQYVKGTLKYMINNKFLTGNYRVTEQSVDDVLVHWCHGAPGIAITLVKAYEVFKDVEFLDAAVAAAEVVWKRGLLKRIGLCHGVSGNAYVFLALYRATKRPEYRYKAKAFAFFLYDKSPTVDDNKQMHCGDHPYSLFEGFAGMSHLFLDMKEPLESRFPGYEL